MGKFLLGDKDFESIKTSVGSTTLEIRNLNNNYYGIFEHIGDQIFVIGELTKPQMKAIWQMLGTEK